MKKLLISTTALSVAISPLGTLPGFAQVLNEDGSVTGADGSVLCLPASEGDCDFDALIEALRETDPAAADALAAQVAAKEAADAEAQAQAEAEAAAAAEAEAQAQAEAEAAAAAEAEAQAQAEAEAAAAAEAEAQAQAEADAAAAAQAEAEAQAQAEADAAAAEAAAAEAAAAEAAAEEAAPAEEPAADAVPAEEPVVEEAPAEEPVVEEPAPAEDAAAEEAVTEEPAAEEPAAEEPAAEEPAAEDPAAEVPAADPAAEGAADVPADAVIDSSTGEAIDPEVAAAAVAAAEAELATDGGEIVDPAAGLKTAEPDPALLAEPVEAPVVSETEVESLTQLLTADPTAIDPSSLAAAELVTAPTTEEPGAVAEADPASLVAEVTETITEDTARTSAEEFAAAPQTLADGKKSGLSDLEKAGLLVLGALAVGAIIKNNREAAATTDTTVSTMGPQESRVVSNTGDRVIVLQPDGTYRVLKDDDTVIRRPGSTVRTETFRDGSTRTIVERADGTQVVTIRDATGRVLRRATYDDFGREIVLIDDLAEEEVVVIRDLPKPQRRIVISSKDDDTALKRELAALEADRAGRKFSLRQIRDIPEVRALAATIDVEPVTFASGSAAVAAREAQNLADLGRVMQELLDENPREVFLIEGHTDATGKAAMNLALSDRRAESVALALTEYFDIPPENMVVQGYGETELLIDTQASEAANRRVEVRVITPLLRTADRG